MVGAEPERQGHGSGRDLITLGFVARGAWGLIKRGWEAIERC